MPERGNTFGKNKLVKNGDTYIKIIIALKKSSLSPKTRHMQAACHKISGAGEGGGREER